MHMAFWKKIEMLIYVRKIPNSDMFTSQNEWYQTPRSTQSKEGIRSKPEARKTTCHAQKRHNRKATYRSGKSRIEKKA